MGNTIIERLNNQLEDQMARLNSELRGDDLKDEIQRTKAMCEIGKVMIDNNRLALDAAKLIQEGKVYKDELKPFMLNNK